MNTQVNNPFTGNTPPGDNKPGIFIHEQDSIKQNMIVSPKKGKQFKS